MQREVLQPPSEDWLPLVTLVICWEVGVGVILHWSLVAALPLLSGCLSLCISVFYLSHAGILTGFRMLPRFLSLECYGYKEKGHGYLTGIFLFPC